MLCRHRSNQPRFIEIFSQGVRSWTNCSIVFDVNRAYDWNNQRSSHSTDFICSLFFSRNSFAALKTSNVEPIKWKISANKADLYNVEKWFWITRAHIGTKENVTESNGESVEATFCEPCGGVHSVSWNIFLFSLCSVHHHDLSADHSHNYFYVHIDIWERMRTKYALAQMPAVWINSNRSWLLCGPRALWADVFNSLFRKITAHLPRDLIRCIVYFVSFYLALGRVTLIYMLNKLFPWSANDKCSSYIKFSRISLHIFISIPPAQLICSQL